MILDQFVTNYTDKTIDTDGAFGGQCMDLMHKYCQDVLGLPDLRILAAPAAKDVYLNFNSVFGKEYFEKIDNTPTGVPKNGDIVFWGTGLGPYGHVAVFIQGDVNSFRSFDQNFPTGSKCHVQNHPSYVGVLGWLRFKTLPATETPQQTIDRLRKELSDLDAQKKNWEKAAGEYQKLGDSYKSKYDSIINQLKGILASS